jgi:hypothetical protein
MSETETDTLTEPEPWGDDDALAWLKVQPGGATQLRPAELGRVFNWSRQKVSRRLAAWVKDGAIVRKGRVITFNKARTRTRTIVKERVIREPSSAPDKGRTKSASVSEKIAVNATRTNEPRAIENKEENRETFKPNLPPADPDKSADAPPQIPPLTTHPDTSKEHRFMWPFTRTKSRAKPVPDMPSAQHLVPAEVPTGRVVTEHEDQAVLDTPEVVKAHAVPRPDKTVRGRVIYEDDDVLPLDGLGWAMMLGAGALTAFGIILATASSHVLYPGVPIPWFPEFAAAMVGTMEIVLLILVAAITRWRLSWWIKTILVVIAIFAEAVSLIAVNAELNAMHQGDRPAVTAAATSGMAEASAQVEYWRGQLTDVDKRIEAYDANAGKLIGADAKRGDRKSIQDGKQLANDPKRVQLSKERDEAAKQLLAAQRDSAKATGKAAVVDAETGVIRKTAALLHVSGESAAEFYIGAQTLLLGPFAAGMVVAANARRRKKRKA